MRMHKSKDYRCLTSNQKEQEYEKKRRNAKNMLAMMPLLVFIFIVSVKYFLPSNFELFGLNLQSLCKIGAILFLFLYVCLIQNYLLYSKENMENIMRFVNNVNNAARKATVKKERGKKNEKK